MLNDERMYFIRNIEALKKNKSIETHVTEYEVISDAEIVGELTYGPYFFTIWEFDLKREGEERKLCLRIRKVDDQYWDSAKRAGFYHGGGISEEIVALASLFLRRRFKLGPIVREDDKPIIYGKMEKFIDKPLITWQSNLGDLSKWLELVENLDGNYHQRFILAVKLYHQAILMIEEHPDMAYLNLISAIEVLCKEAAIGEVKLADLENEKLAELINRIENEDLRRTIEQTILKREHFIGRRFVAFILDYVGKDFWATERPEYGAIKRDDLPKILKRIYDQRSNTLHNGDTFPPYIFRPPTLGAEIVPGLSITHREREWKPQDFIPHPHFFERLVNHVLKNFLTRNKSK